jgi:hypothetical protein
MKYPLVPVEGIRRRYAGGWWARPARTIATAYTVAQAEPMLSSQHRKPTGERHARWGRHEDKERGFCTNAAARPRM